MLSSPVCTGKIIFRRLDIESKSTLPSLKNLVRNLSDRIKKLSAPPSDKIAWGIVAESEPSYSADTSYEKAFSKAFVQLLMN